MPAKPPAKKSSLNPKTKTAFAGASEPAQKTKKKIFPFDLPPFLAKKSTLFVGIPLLLVGGFLYIKFGVLPPQGNNLYGVCRAYIEQHLEFPQTLKIVQLEQRIPDGENKSAPQRINYEVTFSSVDGYGQNLMNVITCGFHFESSLSNTPWQGIVLERVLVNGRAGHGWSDVYYPPDKKNPRMPDDKNEELEYFFNGIPSLLTNPPDLTLPRYKLNRMAIKDLQDM